MSHVAMLRRTILKRHGYRIGHAQKQKRCFSQSPRWLEIRDIAELAPRTVPKFLGTPVQTYTSK